MTQPRMEAKELLHSLAMRASASRGVFAAAAAAAGGKVTDEELQPLAGLKLGARTLALARRSSIVRPHTGASFNAYMLEALHGLTQLPVHLLIRPLSPPSLFSLHSFFKKDVYLEIGCRTN